MASGRARGFRSARLRGGEGFGRRTRESRPRLLASGSGQVYNRGTFAVSLDPNLYKLGSVSRIESSGYRSLAQLNTVSV
ncbi:hypothetical protein Y1Q_0005544 [Alligator mississippiensis]|uniref:Uncharacterized protein n=1 Tax=Alligator mississippiensis TaxID=8496 RepID=A0A151MFB3_ALLMI|nr:hypothetical protein Y1Q_0005544 [Alligator mississippiensis]